MSDYYELLGISGDADAEQIKKAYRKAAMKYHPDRNNGSAEAEQRFKEVSEAYEILRDPRKRAAYDRYGKEGVKQGGAGGPFQGFDIHDAIEIFMRDFGGAGGFEEMFGGRARGGRRSRGSTRRKGESIRVSLPLTLGEVVRGTEKRIRVALLDPCEDCGGTGSADGAQPRTCPRCGGRGEERVAQRSVFGQFVSVTTCGGCGGEGRLIETPCATCRGEGRARSEREVQVEVPPGVTSDNFITLRGKGNAGPRGGPRGDIMVLLDVEEDPRFVRQGSHLMTEVVITFAQAALGDEVEIPTVDGTARITVPPGIQTGQALRLKGEGIPELERRDRGDLLVRVRVWTPTTLSSEQENLLTQLREMEDPPPEKVEDAGAEKRGFWSRVREVFT